MSKFVARFGMKKGLSDIRAINTVCGEDLFLAVIQ